MTQTSSQNQCMSSSTLKEDCQSLFSLKRSNSSSTAPFITVDFSLPPSLKQDPFFNSINLIPTFNRDRKFYTPSFILGSELNKYITNDDGYRMVHEKKIQQMQEERAEIFVPKPSKANSYCCICREPFEDYLTHINVPRHKELMKNSPYYTMIEDLCGTYNQNGQGQQNEQKKNEKTDNIIVPKRKKIIKVNELIAEKKPRGRPRKNHATKMQMLASIPTNVSIWV